MARIAMGPLTRALVVGNRDPSLDELLREDGLTVVRHAGSPGEDELIGLLR